MALKQLRGYQRKWLRSKAHSLSPVVLVGTNGITDAVIAATGQALLDHELIKVRLRRPEDKKVMAQNLADRCDAHLCGLVGHTVILYRRHPKKPRIALPQREE